MTNPHQQGDRKQRTYLKSVADLIDRVAGEGMVPPHSLEVEQSILGTLMLDRAALDKVQAILGDGSAQTTPFYRDAHTLIYRACLQVNERHEEIDMLTVTNELKRMGRLAEAGGPAYLFELSTHVVTTVNVVSHARIVVEKWLARELIKTCEEMKLRAFSGADDVFELYTETEQALMQSVQQRLSRGHFKSLHAAGAETIGMLDEIEKKGSEVTGVPTGLKELDNLTGGWQKGDLIVVGARPSMGKSALANKFAHACSVERPESERGTTVFVSLEMSATSLAMRMMAMDAQVSMTRMRKGWLADGEWERIGEAQRKYSGAPVEIFTADSIDVKRIRAELRHRFVQLERTTHPLSLIIIDYLGLIDMPGDNQVREISKVTRTLKLLAKELNLPIILLVQLNRELEKRLNKEPQLSDLRDSGSIEQDADIVFFLYRPEWYGIHVFGESESERFAGKPTKGLAKGIIAKQRNGETGTIYMAFDGAHARFADVPDDVDQAADAFRRADEQRYKQEDMAF